jgi:protein-L-isoaspartate(D-aspartate) O-methyltransferase
VPSGFNALFVNAGCTHPRAAWLDGLAVGGRLLLPLTSQASPQHSSGILVRVGRETTTFSAEIVSRISIFDCEGARDAAESDAIAEMVESAAASRVVPPVKTLLRQPHERAPTCVLHTARYCLSTAS